MIEQVDHQPHEARAAFFAARGGQPRPPDPAMIERTGGESRQVHPARAAYFRNKIRAARNAPTSANRTRGGLFVDDAMLCDWQARR